MPEYPNAEPPAVSQREEIRGVGHPAWPDPLGFNWGPDPRANAAAWLDEHRGQHPGIEVQRRFVTEWEAFDPAAPDSDLAHEVRADAAVVSAQSTDARVWPVGSPAPDESVKLVVAENDVTFKRTPWGRWRALPPEGNDRDYPWSEINGLMVVTEVLS